MPAQTDIASPVTVVAPKVASNPMLEAALRYANLDWYILPCEAGGKRPLTAHGLKDATVDEQQIRAWWSKWPDANIGIACRASELVVLDVDQHGVDGEATLHALIAKHGTLPETCTAATGGGGRHLFFKNPDGDMRGSLGPGLDVRSNGYVIGSPSDHESGRKYEWVASPEYCPPAELPEAWVDLLRRPKRRTRNGVRAAGSNGTAYGRAALAREAAALRIAPNGSRNTSLNRAAFSIGNLVAGGELDEDRAREELQRAALDVGLTAKEIEQTTDSGLGAGQQHPRSAPVLDEGAFPTILAADVEPREVEWLVEGHIPTGSCGFITGQPGVEKTWLTEEFAVAIASGQPVAGGLATTSGPVLIFNAEDDPATITRKRLDALARGRDLELADLPIYLVDTAALRLDLPEHINRLKKTVRAIQPLLLVLDPLRNLHWKNEDSSTELTPILDAVRSIQRETSVAVLLVHHDRKQSDSDGGRRESRSRGTNSLEGWRDFAIYLDKHHDVVTVCPYVKAVPRPAEWTFTLEDGDDGAIHLAAGTLAERLQEEIVNQLRARPEGMTRGELRAALGKGRLGVKLAIDAVLGNRVVCEVSASRTRMNGRPQPVTLLRPSPNPILPPT